MKSKIDSKYALFSITVNMGKISKKVVALSSVTYTQKLSIKPERCKYFENVTDQKKKRISVIHVLFHVTSCFS